MAFGAEFFELCPHRGKPPLEDNDDLIADLGGREDGSVYKPTPTINLIWGADDYFTSMRYTLMRRSVSSICCIRSSMVMARSPFVASAIEPCAT